MSKSLGPTNISVSPLWTILQLKQRFHKDFGYPIGNQSWIFQSTLMVDNKMTLLDYKVIESTDVYLYLADPDVAGGIEASLAPLAKVTELEEISISLTKTMEFEAELERFEAEVAKSPSGKDVSKKEDQKEDKTEKVLCPSITVKPKDNEVFVVSKTTSEPLFTSTDMNILDVSDTEESRSNAVNETPPEPPQRSTSQKINSRPILPLQVRSQASASTSTTRETSKIEHTINKIDALQSQLKKPAEKPQETNWACAICTLINTHSGEDCAACMHKRTKPNPIPKPPRDAQNLNNPVVSNPIVMTALVNPNVSKTKYRGVDNYNPAALVFPTVAEALKSKNPIIKTVMMKNPDHFELPTPAKPQSNTNSAKKKKKPAPAPPLQLNHNGNTYLELLNMDTTGFVPNTEPFECSICFVEYERAEGAVLRDCLHTFCRECLARTVEYSEEPAVKCPYIDADYSCESNLQVCALILTR